MILREVRFRAKFHALHFFAASGCLYRNSIRGPHAAAVHLCVRSQQLIIVAHPLRTCVKRVAEAMLKMIKLDIEGLKKAYEGRSP
jgi:hypothetical protein